MIRLRPRLAAAVALIALAHPAAAQTRNAADILREASTRARARTQGVQNYTVHTKTVGMSLVSYVSRGPDGTFQIQSGGTGPMAASASEMTGWGDGLLLLLEGGLADELTKPGETETVTYEGVVNSGGVPAHRISVSMPEESAAAAGEDMPRRFTVDFDTATLLAQRMEADMTVGGGTPRGMLMELSDWRAVGGMMLPYHRHMVIRGMRAEVMGADTTNAAQTLAQGRAMVAGLPKDQQEGMRQMLDLIESMLKRDEMVLDEIVTAVVVNQGPPPGVALGPAKDN
jgi:hypothetical protein